MRREPRRRLARSCAAPREHNLKNIDVEFPLGCFVAVTGVSGSGKSTLVNDILYRSLMQRIYRSKMVPGPPQDDRGRSSSSTRSSTSTSRRSGARRAPTRRPTPACSTTSASCSARRRRRKVRGYLPGRFSFNVKGGRCEACAGDGTIKIEMHFLPDVYVPCEVCKGARYNRDTLDITFKGKNIAEVLDLSCEEAARVLRQPARHRPPHADARRRRPRLRAARPARADAVGRRGAAGEAGRRAGQALHRPHHLHPRRAHHRPPLRGHPQAAHRAHAAWSTRATPCS